MGGGAAPTEVDETVAKLIVEEIPNGACLQLGIGGMPNAVGSLIAKSDLKDLGVHTEMYVDAFVDIAEAGKITGAHKAIDKGRQVYGFGAGTKKLYDYLNNNPACMSAPVSYTNDVRVVAQLDNFMSINNAVDIDLFGQVSSCLLYTSCKRVAALSAVLLRNRNTHETESLHLLNSVCREVLGLVNFLR